MRKSPKGGSNSNSNRSELDGYFRATSRHKEEANIE